MKAAAQCYFECRYQLLSYGFWLRTEFEDVARFLHDLLSRYQTSARVAREASTYTLCAYPDNPEWVALYLDNLCLNAAPSWPQVLDAFFWHVNREAFLRVEDRLVIHSAAVSWNGVGTIMPGAPNSGKTTLSAGLTRAGFAFLSDEAALIDPETGRLHPFPRVLAVDERSRRALQSVGAELPPEHRRYTGATSFLRPDHLGRVGGSCRVRFVIAPRYEEGQETTLEQAGRAEMLITLIENCFNLEAFGELGFAALAGVIRQARCYLLRVGDLGEAIRAVRAVVQ